MRGKRAQAAATLSPFLGAALFMPPYVTLFDRDVQFLGVPLLPLALFGLWFIGLLLTARIAHTLPPSDSGDADDDRHGDGGNDGNDGGRIRAQRTDIVAGHRSRITEEGPSDTGTAQVVEQSMERSMEKADGTAPTHDVA